MIIYKTTNLINNKVYVGKDCKNNPSYLGSGLLLKRAINKYGRHNFIKEVIDNAENINDLNEKEIFWIDKLNTFTPIGYNIARGGTGGDTTSHHPRRQDIINKRSETIISGCILKGRKSPNKDKILSKSYRENISKGVLCRYREQPEIKNKISSTLKGHKVSEETRLKISSRVKEVMSSKEIMNKITKSVINLDTGRIFSSVKEAVEFYGVDSSSSISRSCRRPNRRAGGYRWAYYKVK